MIGQTISHYKILEKIGEGGMGVVYKVHDFKLDRYLALKFLPQHLTTEPTEKARFLQEAKAASALNHPNVCVIHDIQEKEDQQFIVMEYVDGVTLRKRLQDSSLKLNEVVSYAIQIGEALQEAHNKGIVHRDVKPENIMLNSKNQIKVMDFGLAKLKGSLKLTRTSTTVGTLAYMAPEQIQGEEVDARSDIFSFGIVLFEMLTGRTPFRGEHEAAMMYSIVHEEPEPVQKYCPELSSEMLHILNRALEKDSNDRYQSVAEMVIDLRRVKKDSDKVSRKWLAEMPVASKEPAIPQAPPAPQTVGVSKKKLKIGLGIAASLVLIAVMAVLLLWNANRPKELNPNMTFRTLEIPFTQVDRPGLSRDGNWVSFPAADANGRWDLYFMNTSGGEPRRITFDSTTFVGHSDVSPEGSQIIYDFINQQTRRWEVHLISSLGGVGRTLAAPGCRARWRPDGERIGYLAGQGWNVPSQSGKLEFRSVKPDGSDDRLEFIDSVSDPNYMDSWFDWSPDGQSVAWARIYSPWRNDLMVKELKTAKESQLTFDKNDITGISWAENDRIIFSCDKSGNHNLWMVPAAGGPEIQVTKGGGNDLGPKISVDGRKLVYLQEQPIGQVWVAKLDGSGSHPVTLEASRRYVPFLSPQGNLIAFSMWGRTKGSESYEEHIYVVNRDGGSPRQISYGKELASVPKWSPDGKWIAYVSRQNNQPLDSNKVYLAEVANPGKPKLIAKGIPYRWLDSERLMVIGSTLTNAWIVYMDGREPERFYQDSTISFPILKEKYILYRDLHPDRAGIWVILAENSKPLPGQMPKKILGPSYPFGIGPDGSFLVYVKNDGELWKLILPEGKEERLPGTFSGLALRSTLSVSYDGKEVVYVDGRTTGKLVMIENLFK